MPCFSTVSSFLFKVTLKKKRRTLCILPLPSSNVWSKEKEAPPHPPHLRGGRGIWNSVPEKNPIDPCSPPYSCRKYMAPAQAGNLHHPSPNHQQDYNCSGKGRRSKQLRSMPSISQPDLSLWEPAHDKGLEASITHLPWSLLTLGEGQHSSGMDLVLVHEFQTQEDLVCTPRISWACWLWHPSVTQPGKAQHWLEANIALPVPTANWNCLWNCLVPISDISLAV